MSEATKPVTPKALAAELGIDPKRLRGYLRKEYARDASAKGSSWNVPQDACDAARARFAPADDSESVA